ncbi:MAG: anti-sigma factor [Chloroflexota bacterium]|nr:anti-sigma factor [Chloroflexota bacterium]
MKCEHVRADLAAYALGSLSAAERTAIERHLAGCADCRRQAAELADAVAMLPRALAAASPLAPPASLKADLLGRLDLAPAPTAAVNEEQARSLPDLSAERQLPGPVAAGPAVPPRRFGPRSLAGVSWQTVGRIAAVVVLALSLAWSFRLTVALENERTLRSEYAGLVGQIVSQQEIVFEVVDSEQSVRRILAAAREGSTAYGKLFTRTDLPHVVAMAARLPAASAGQTFHLWLTTGGETNLAGELTTDDEGFGLIVFDAPGDGPTYDAAELTLQPAGGATPGGTVILTWEAAGP